jgi:hypothetical protein
MKIRTVLAAVVVPSLFALVGCKSPYEKFADDACACKDEACLKGLGEKHKDIAGGSMKDVDAKRASLSDKDKEALDRGIACAFATSLKAAKQKE